ncbi:hypothetical protein [Amnibacterium sp.]|uniref:hypothetical protein n=1 Tax=Amnibacterium sp. TaxID=1872496 RepID=UPI003F7B967E
MLEHVVVAWTGSARARAALEWARRRPTTRAIRLLRVLPDDDGGHDVAAGARLALEAEVDRLHEVRPDLEVASSVVHGDVEAALLGAAAPGALLALGVGGAAALRLPHRSALLAAIAREAVGPVALVPVHGGDPHGPVIAGVDGTAAGVAAAQVAATEAAATGTSLVAVHVHPRGPIDGWPGGSLDAAARDITAHLPHLLVRQRIVRGDVRAELRSAATGASLLVIGRHRSPGPGSELEHDAVAGMACPVLLVRAEDARWSAPAAASGAAVAPAG